jgi:polyhydroxybutyrate depolymerase
MKLLSKLVFLLIMASFSAIAQESVLPAQLRMWPVGDQQREALLYIPESATEKLTPVIFVFHGHGGNMEEMFRSHRFDKLWPEAIIVVAQGLKTPGKLVDMAGRLSGWLQQPGELGDRDIHFFDIMLQSLKAEYKIDSKRIFATGHSNGGSFTYLLWAMRGDALTAIAPSAGLAAGYDDLLKPKPVLHIMGSADKLVKLKWQQSQINKLLFLNKCDRIGKPYASSATLFPSATGNPVVVYQFPGRHIYPPGAEAIAIEFFQSIVK